LYAKAAAQCCPGAKDENSALPFRGCRLRFCNHDAILADWWEPNLKLTADFPKGGLLAMLSTVSHTLQLPWAGKIDKLSIRIDELQALALTLGLKVFNLASFS
jgi:hypothetical protein